MLPSTTRGTVSLTSSSHGATVHLPLISPCAVLLQHDQPQQITRLYLNDDANGTRLSNYFKVGDWGVSHVLKSEGLRAQSAPCARMNVGVNGGCNLGRHQGHLLWHCCSHVHGCCCRTRSSCPSWVSTTPTQNKSSPHGYSLGPSMGALLCKQRSPRALHVLLLIW